MAEFLAKPTNQGVLERLRAAGRDTEEPGAGRGGGAAGRGPAGRCGGPAAQTLAGKTVVVTGHGARLHPGGGRGGDLARGGKSPGSVSKKTFALVVGDAPGASKLKKAEELGIPDRRRRRVRDAARDRGAACLTTGAAGAGGVHRLRA